MHTLGLLSDSHGDAAITRRAVDLLLDAGAQALIHLGDVGTAAVIDALAVMDRETGEPLPVYMVFGNTDWEAAALGRYAQGLGMQVYTPAGRLEIAGKTLAFTHGHVSQAMNAALADQVDYLLHGHTHLAADHRQAATRVINPGALTRANPLSVATLNVVEDLLIPLVVRGGSIETC